jgi:hypothetical protein
MEDVIPDINVPTPEQIVESEELRNCVRQALSGLGKDAQLALTLRYIVGLHGKALESSLRKPEAKVNRLMEMRASIFARNLSPRTAPSEKKTPSPQSRDTRKNHLTYDGRNHLAARSNNR